MKRVLLLSLTALLIFAVGSASARASHTMSWGFQLLNNPNARQVALNIANAQQELLRTTEDQSGIDRFKESLDRMAMSKAIRDIVYYDPNSDAPGYGFVPVEWDEVSETMKIFHFADGGWTEITIDSGSQPPPPAW
jgi:type IV secretory pathway VirJ component